MFDTIARELSTIEQQEQLRILYACEAGSRAWGFASQDSDFDVRFIYVRRRDYYLSLSPGREVIERMLPGDLDLAGWDLRKTLKLLLKSNPALLEWLSSPIVYKQDEDFYNAMNRLMPDYYQPRNCMYHYAHMAKGNYRGYLQGERVWTKKYLYVIRPILACMWLDKVNAPVPMAMKVMMDEVLPEGEARDALEELIEEKKQAKELDEGPRIPALDKLIEVGLASYLALAQTLPVHQVQQEPLERFFRSQLY